MITLNDPGPAPAPIAIPAPAPVAAPAAIGTGLPPVTLQLLLPLVGRGIVVRTRRETLRGTLVSCVSTSAWVVVGDTDRVVPLDDMIAVWGC
jgi:hypothetical protein